MPPPSSTDLVVGFDPTGYTSISGAQLGQLVNSAGPYTDKGLNIFTTDAAGVPNVPDANATTKWQRYMWIRYSPITTSVSAYIWNPDQIFNISYTDGSTNFVASNWNPIAFSNIPAGSIFGYMIAPATITKDKIVSIDISQVTGFSAAGYVQTVTVPAAGDIGGTYAIGFNIGNGKVTLAKIDATAGLADQVQANVAATSVIWKYVYNLLVGQAAKVTPVAADYVQIMDSADSFNGKKVLLNNFIAAASATATNRFVSAETALPANCQGVVMNTAHGLTVVGVATAPSKVRCVLKCIDAGGDQTYLQNDEVDVSNTSDDNTQRDVFAVLATSTNVVVAVFTNAANEIRMVKRDGTDFTGVLDPTKWKVKVYAEI